MKAKQPFSEKSAVRGASRKAEVVDRLHSYIDYVDTADLIMSFYGQWANQGERGAGRGVQPD